MAEAALAKFNAYVLLEFNQVTAPPRLYRAQDAIEVLSFSHNSLHFYFLI